MSPLLVRVAAVVAASLTTLAGLAACSQLLGTDFNGSPRDEDAAAEDGAIADGTLPPDGATSADGAAPGPDGSAGPDAGGGPDGASLDSSDPYYAICSFQSYACSCQGFSFPDDGGPCDESAFPSGWCCADPGYPATGQCSCGSWECKTLPSGTCFCGWASEGGAGGTCSDSYCCAHPIVYTCTCASAQASACPTLFVDANNIPVTTCALPNQPCPNGGHRVASCSKF